MEDSKMPLVLQPGYRLVTSIAIAILIFILSKPWLPSTGSRVVLGWDTAVTVWLTLTVLMMWRTEPHETLGRARHEETSNILILLVTIVAVGAALVDMRFGLTKSEILSPSLRVFEIFASVAGVFLAWLLLHTMFSLHYAKLYYGEIDDADMNAFRKGLTFPGNNDVVDYWDFVYYSFTIGMCFQTSDVTVVSPYMRRLTIFHATIAYLFAFAILGLLLDGFLANL